MKTALSFDDVLLVPQYSEIESRKQILIKQNLRSVGNFSLPIISSPMDTVTGESMACAMDSAGGVGIIHRYNDMDEQAKIVMNVTSAGHNVGAAIGVGDDCIDRALCLSRAGVSFLCIDVAHGHHSKVRYALEMLREVLGRETHIMAGNVATLEAFNDLADWGADSIRVGIGGGSICSTRIQTGHGMPTLQSIIDCARSDRDAALIADGGIRTSGDIVKALAAGADFVMVGSLLAGTSETPGEVFRNANGKRYKVYRGMASEAAQNDWRGKSSSPEGISTTVPYKGKTFPILVDLHGGIRSGFSYTGARNFTEFYNKSEFIKQSNAGQSESFTHILKRRE